MSGVSNRQPADVSVAARGYSQRIRCLTSLNGARIICSHILINNALFGQATQTGPVSSITFHEAPHAATTC